MTPGERVARKQKAEQLIDHDLRGVFEGVEGLIVEKLKAVAVGDRDTQHELVLTLQLLGRLRAHLRSWIQDGQLAEAEIRQEEAIRRRKSRA